jgi:betaine-aldehyde dehydrogenase
VSEKRVLRNVVGGESVDAADGRTSDLIDPATGAVVGSAPVSGPQDVDRAFAAAASAFETWRDTTPSERQRALLRLADAIEAHADELVQLEAENTGKPLAMTASEEIPRLSTRSASSRAPRACWRASQPGSTWPATPRSYAASRSASAPR